MGGVTVVALLTITLRHIHGSSPITSDHGRALRQRVIHLCLVGFLRRRNSHEVSVSLLWLLDCLHRTQLKEELELVRHDLLPEHLVQFTRCALRLNPLLLSPILFILVQLVKLQIDQQLVVGALLAWVRSRLQHLLRLGFMKIISSYFLMHGRLMCAEDGVSRSITLLNMFELKAGLHRLLSELTPDLRHAYPSRIDHSCYLSWFLVDQIVVDLDFFHVDYPLLAFHEVFLKSRYVIVSHQV